MGIIEVESGRAADYELARRADARWLGGLLGRLSDKQIRDAFQAAGYGPDEVESFTQELRQRIAELNNL